AHYNLGVTVLEKGNLIAARHAFEQAIALDLKHSWAHNMLGTVLADQGNPAGAILHYRKAIDLDPKNARAHCNLGNALLKQGNFTGALKELQLGHELGSKETGWPYPSAGWVHYCKALVERDTRLSAILKGDAQPRGAADQLALA